MILQKKCARAIISSFYFHIVLSALGVGLYIMFPSDCILTFIAINLFMMLQGLAETRWAYGDLVGYQKIINNYIEFLIYISFVLSEDDEVKLDVKNFVIKEIKEKCKNIDGVIGERLIKCMEVLDN